MDRFPRSRFARRFWQISAAFGVISLAGCASGITPPPAIEIRTVTKTVEVQKPCPVTIPQRPAKLATPLPNDAVRLAALLGAKLVEWAGPGGYGDRADAALRKCAPTQP